jgi:hypothetical protein
VFLFLIAYIALDVLLFAYGGVFGIAYAAALGWAALWVLRSKLEAPTRVVGIALVSLAYAVPPVLLISVVARPETLGLPNPGLGGALIFRFAIFLVVTGVAWAVHKSAGRKVAG